MGALQACEKVREAISRLRVSGVERRISASFGIAVHPDDADDPETLMRMADRALYAAKGAGRDRVEAVARPALNGSSAAA